MTHRLLAILGAGASYDSQLYNPPKSDRVPPLTKDLFSGSFEDTLQRFPGAQRLRHVIESRVERGAEFETVLANLMANTNSDIRGHMKHVTPYIRELVGTASRGPAPSAYDSLIHLIQERDIEVFFVTLNYDLLLEDAIRRSYRDSGLITGFDHYVQPGRPWQLAKPHGSVNWVRRLATGPSTGGIAATDRLHGLSEYLIALSESEPSEELRFLDIDGGSDPLRIVDGERFVVPELALPSDRKYGFVCSSDQTDALSEFVATGPAVLAIGTQGLDRDLMDLLKSESQHGSGLLTVVDPSEDAVQSIAKRFADVMKIGGWNAPRAQLFREFVGSEAAERFLDQVAAG